MYIVKINNKINQSNIIKIFIKNMPIKKARAVWYLTHYTGWSRADLRKLERDLKDEGR